MKKSSLIACVIALSACAALPTAASAAGVYGGIGYPGLTLGYDYELSSTFSLRGEYSGGLKLSRNGQRSGVDFNGNFAAQSIGAFADWYPIAGSGFRATGGATINTTKATLASNGNNSTATINGRPVNLTGETFNVELKYPRVTPYIGVGYNTNHNRSNGWGFYIDAGVTIGKFDTSVSTSLVGKQGVTQADVDAQTSKVRDSVNKLSVLPKFSIGAIYSF